MILIILSEGNSSVFLILIVDSGAGCTNFRGFNANGPVNHCSALRRTKTISRIDGKYHADWIGFDQFQYVYIEIMTNKY